MASAPTPLIERIRLLAVAAESPAGTPATLTNSDCNLIVINPKVEDKTEKMLREMEASLGYYPGIPGVSLGEVTFSIDLSAESASPAWASLLLPGCGIGGSGPYVRDIRQPEVSGSTQKTLTIGLYQNGILETIYGAQGNMIAHFMAGHVVRADFTFKGIYTVPANATMLVQTASNPALVRFINSSITFASFSPKVSELDLDLGNDIQVREDSTSGTGIWHAMIQKFTTVAKINPEMNLVSDNDVHGIWYAGTQQAFSFQAANTVPTGGDIAAFSMTKGEYVNLKKGARHELMTWDVGIQDQNTDLTVTFTPHS
jgi:hypothetical protein